MPSIHDMLPFNRNPPPAIQSGSANTADGVNPYCQSMLHGRWKTVIYESDPFSVAGFPFSRNQ